MSSFSFDSHRSLLSGDQGLGLTAWVHGQRMRLLDPATDRHISPILAAHGQIEPFETEWLLSLVRPGDTVLDLGAHIGYYTLLLARQVGAHGRVLAFEPDPTNFAVLSENIARGGYRSVTLFNLAVAERSGSIHLHRCTDNAGDHRIWPDATDVRQVVPIQAVALDSLFGPYGPTVNLIKMDIQGAELAATRGMARLLMRQPHVWLVTEFWPKGLRGAGADPAEFLKTLSGLGFRFHRIDETTHRLVRTEPLDLLALIPPESEDHTNLVCVKS